MTPIKDTDESLPGRINSAFAFHIPIHGRTKAGETVLVLGCADVEGWSPGFYCVSADGRAFLEKMANVTLEYNQLVAWSRQGLATGETAAVGGSNR
jgi:hypothetical protein